MQHHAFLYVFDIEKIAADKSHAAGDEHGTSAISAKGFGSQHNCPNFRDPKLRSTSVVITAVRLSASYERGGHSLRVSILGAIASFSSAVAGIDAGRRDARADRHAWTNRLQKSYKVRIRLEKVKN